MFYKWTAKVTVIALALSFALSLSARAADFSVAILHVEQAILTSEEAQVMVEKFNKETVDARNDIEKLRGELLGLQEQMRQDGDVMSDEQRERMANEAEDKQIDLEHLVRRLRKDTQDKREEVLKALAPKFEAVLKDLIDLEGYDVVLPAQTTLWVNPKHDITRRLTEKLNARK